MLGPLLSVCDLCVETENGFLMMGSLYSCSWYNYCIIVAGKLPPSLFSLILLPSALFFLFGAQANLTRVTAMLVRKEVQVVQWHWAKASRRLKKIASVFTLAFLCYLTDLLFLLVCKQLQNPALWCLTASTCVSHLHRRMTNAVT